MKKAVVALIITLALLASSTLAGCSNPKTSLVGEWHTQSEVSDFAIIHFKDSRSYTYGIEFLEDGTALVVLSMQGILLKTDPFMEWSVDGDRFAITTGGNPLTLYGTDKALQGTYQIDGSQLTLTLDSGLIVKLKKAE
jgi:hypothetical protein